MALEPTGILFYALATIAGVHAMVVANTRHPCHGGELSAVLILTVTASALAVLSFTYPEYMLLGNYSLSSVSTYLSGSGVLALHWHIIRAQSNWDNHEKP
jgi:hypothetical protein